MILARKRHTSINKPELMQLILSKEGWSAYTIEHLVKKPALNLAHLVKLQPIKTIFNKLMLTG